MAGRNVYYCSKEKLKVIKFILSKKKEMKAKDIVNEAKSRGLSRPTVYRCLGKLRKQGLIIQVRRGVWCLTFEPFIKIPPNAETVWFEELGKDPGWFFREAFPALLEPIISRGGVRGSARFRRRFYRDLWHIIGLALLVSMKYESFPLKYDERKGLISGLKVFIESLEKLFSKTQGSYEDLWKGLKGTLKLDYFQVLAKEMKKLKELALKAQES